MPRDAPSSDILAADWSRGIDYFCRRCGQWVSRGGWEMVMNGSHEHVVFNPAGIVFRVLCFRDAPGALAHGAASGVFSWFKGYQWRLCACRGCEAHLGWRYEGSAEPRIFFGLIKDALTTSRP